MKNICLVVDSFKGSATSPEIEEYIETGIKRAKNNYCVTKIPITDGGEGFTEIITNRLGGQIHNDEITGPYGVKKQAQWGQVEDTVIIETAEAVGLSEKGPDDSPEFGTSYGLGELIRTVLTKSHPDQVLIGLGGSATNDAGTGMAQALGFRFLDQNSQTVEPLPQNFAKIKTIDDQNVDKRIYDVKFVGLSDVLNPLLGLDGATYRYGTQKGIREKDMAESDANMSKIAKLVTQLTAHNDEVTPGSGAAGGIGFGILTFLKGSLLQAMPEVIKMLNVETQIANCDLVVTGEGQLDSQSLDGKVSCEVARLAKKWCKPVIGIVGNVNANSSVLDRRGFNAVFTANIGPQSLEMAMKDIQKNVEFISQQIFAVLDVQSSKNM